MDTEETKSAKLQQEYLFRVQIHADNVSAVLDAIINVTPLRYGNYDQVAFRHCAGIQQYRPLAGSKTGEGELVQLPCDEISFTVPARDEVITAVIEAIIESHIHEEPVILIQEALCTRFKYGHTGN